MLHDPFIGAAVVALRPADLDEVVRVAGFLELFQVLLDGVGQLVHGVAEGVAEVGRPVEDLVLAVGRDPVKGPVFPGDSRPANAVGVVRAVGDVFHAGLGKAGNEAPGQARARR